MAKLTDAYLEFLEQPCIGVATTLRADGSPHSTVVWVDVDDGLPSFNTALGRAKPNHLERDPRVGLTVIDANDMYRWLTVNGRAELTTDGADAQIDKLAKKYWDEDVYSGRTPGQQRVKVRITPEQVTTYGFD